MNIVVSGGRVFQGDDLEKLTEEIEIGIQNLKMSYVDRAYGIGGWV